MLVEWVELCLHITEVVKGETSGLGKRIKKTGNRIDRDRSQGFLARSN